MIEVRLIQRAAAVQQIPIYLNHINRHRVCRLYAERIVVAGDRRSYSEGVAVEIDVRDVVAA